MDLAKGACLHSFVLSLIIGPPIKFPGFYFSFLLSWKHSHTGYYFSKTFAKHEAKFSYISYFLILGVFNDYWSRELINVMFKESGKLGMKF